jgi:hypothetical protein
MYLDFRDLARYGEALETPSCDGEICGRSLSFRASRGFSDPESDSEPGQSSSNLKRDVPARDLSGSRENRISRLVGTIVPLLG